MKFVWLFVILYPIKIINKMNKFKIMVIGGAMFLCSLPIMSKKYFLYSTIINNDKHTQNGSRAPKRPLCVDCTNNVLTVPEQLLGYTLTVTDEEENVFSCFLTSNVIYLPSNLVGELNILFTDGNQTFFGIIDAE